MKTVKSIIWQQRETCNPLTTKKGGVFACEYGYRYIEKVKSARSYTNSSL
jgi:hypothetical protein